MRLCVWCMPVYVWVCVCERDRQMDTGRHWNWLLCGKHSLSFEQAACYNDLVWLELNKQGFESCLHHTRAGYNLKEKKYNNSLSLFSCGNKRDNYCTYLWVFTSIENRLLIWDGLKKVDVYQHYSTNGRYLRT